MSKNNKPGIGEPELRAPEIVSSLQKLSKGTVLRKYISHVRFPRFKNIQAGSRIDFDFPITALVGPNGCGKTSALHALYGAPQGKSTSDFWFATDVDPITEGNGEPNRFIYGHWLDGQLAPVETRKARVGKSKQRKPGYFEPTKAVVGDGMDTSPFPATVKVAGQSKDRWNPVERNLVYINFRSELSAFDKYLFWAKPKPTKTLQSKHERLQLGARRLKTALDDKQQTYLLFGKNVVFENRNLSSNELGCLCAILGKDYAEARLIRHRFYGNEEGISVRFKTKHAEYSEAFAGSGELAVASLVVQLCSAEKYSLVLLDEPEVSLHPGAQERLLVFLMEEALKHKHQVVFTTHSPGLVRHLPPSAIKVFYETADGTFAVVNETHPYAAFNRLGSPVPNKIRVLVEDRLAKHVVDLALLNLNEDEQSIFEVAYLPGGSSSYFAHRIPTLMHEATATFLLLDGDQCPLQAYPNPDTIPSSEDGTLESLIKELTGCGHVQLGADGGNDASAVQKANELRRKYLRYLKDRVRFLPASCPEVIVLKAIDGDAAPNSPQQAKEELAKKTRSSLGVGSSDDIDDYSRILLAEKRMGNKHLEDIVEILREFLGGLKP